MSAQDVMQQHAERLRVRRSMPFFWWSAEQARTKAAEVRAVLTVVPSPDDTQPPKAA